MRRKFLRVVVLLLAGLLPAVAIASEDELKENKITLKRWSFKQKSSEKGVVKAGKLVSFEVNAYISTFFKDTIINAGAKITNNTDKPRIALYIITFYDKDGKILGAHATTWPVKPKATVNYGSGIIKGKEADFQRVAKYRLYVCSYEAPPAKKE